LTASNISAQEIESPGLTLMKEHVAQLASVSGDLILRLNNLSSGFASKSEEFEARISMLENYHAVNMNELLDIKGGLSVTGVTTLSGGLSVNDVSSIGEALNFLSDAVFFGRPYFNSDTAGFAMIKKGAKSVDIVFEREYLEQPVVNANISVEASDSISEEEIFAQNIQYLVIKKTTKGFTIILNKPAPEDIRFSWIALAVKNPKTFFSLIEATPETRPASTPAPEPEATPELMTPNQTEQSPGGATEQSSGAELTPEPTPEPTPESTPEPTTESTPAPTLNE